MNAVAAARPARRAAPAARRASAPPSEPTLSSTSTKPQTSTPRTAQRERILDALFGVMAQGGGAAASVSEIAERAGIARGALHYYFESKDELVVALMRRLGDTYVARLSAYLERELSAGRPRPTLALVGWHFGLPAAVATSLTPAPSQTPSQTPSLATPSSATPSSEAAANLLAVWIEFWGQAPTRADIGAVVYDVQEQARGLFARALCAERLDLRAAPPAMLRDHAATLLAVVEGGLLQWRIAASSADPFARARLGSALVAGARAVVDAIPVSAVSLSASEESHVRP